MRRKHQSTHLRVERGERRDEARRQLVDRGGEDEGPGVGGRRCVHRLRATALNTTARGGRSSVLLGPLSATSASARGTDGKMRTPVDRKA